MSSRGARPRVFVVLKSGAGFGLDVTAVEEGVEVGDTNSVGLADAYRAELSGLDQPVHRHRRYSHVLSYLSDSQISGALAFVHVGGSLLVLQLHLVHICREQPMWQRETL